MRLLIVGTLKGQLTTATKIAMDNGASVTHAEDNEQAMRVLRGIGHRSKIEKLGAIRGTRAHVSMTFELLQCLTFVPLWTYGSYLRNLTVLDTI